ncbi:MAG: hypothetical protein SF028_09405 [Candidatus Sumerlaeia bacterium]|nr:hypothetical protein [Candidatus Sumerlaeia bacterium]
MTRRPAAPRALAAALALIAAATAHAKIDLVTLPQRDSTQLTIYKAEDLTLVREVRELTFSQGANQIQFSWANTLIDPTSLQIRVVDNTRDFTVLDASYPANSQNTIVWNIEAAKGGKAKVEITCFASGLTWRADYTLIANADETALRLEPDFTITNNSGEDFANANTRLVVGEVNLVEAIAELARRGFIPREEGDMLRARRDFAKEMLEMPASAPMAVGRAMNAFDAQEAKAIIKKAVSEYYLYSIEGTEDLETGWGKQLPNPRVDGIKFDLSYEYQPEKYGEGVVKFYKFKNTTEHKLGETPLPEGAVYAYGDDGRGGLRFHGSTSIKYSPVGEDIELNLGADGTILVEPKLMKTETVEFEYNNNGDITGWDTVSTYQLEFRNSRTRPVPMKTRLNFGQGDWELRDSSTAFKQIDRERAEWELALPALATTTIDYKVYERHGSRTRTTPPAATWR